MKLFLVGKTFLIIFFLFALLFPAPATLGAEEKPWTSFSSEHFLFLVEKGSQADQDRKKIIDFYESTITDLERRFQHQLSPSDLITIRLYEDYYSGDVFHLTEIIKENQTIIDIYNKNNPPGAHELVHAYFELSWGRPQLRLSYNLPGIGSLDFLGEALATALDRYYSPSKGSDLHAYASCFLKEGAPYSLRNLLAGSPPLGEIEHWAARGSFVLYLLENYPWTNFVTLWQTKPTSEEPLQDLNEGTLQAYQKTALSLENEWLSFLRQYPTIQWQETAKRIRELDSILTNLDSAFGKQQEEGKFYFWDFPSLTKKEYELKFPSEPLKGEELAALERRIGELKSLALVAEQLLQLSQDAESNLRSENWPAAYKAYQSMRECLAELGDTKRLSWVDNQLAELRSKITPEVLESLEKPTFPWWGWVLIGCGVAGVLGLGGWLFIRKKRFIRKEKGQQP